MLATRNLYHIILLFIMFYFGFHFYYTCVNIFICISTHECACLLFVLQKKNFSYVQCKQFTIHDDIIYIFGFFFWRNTRISNETSPHKITIPTASQRSTFGDYERNTIRYIKYRKTRLPNTKGIIIFACPLSMCGVWLFLLCVSYDKHEMKHKFQNLLHTS